MVAIAGVLLLVLSGLFITCCCFLRKRLEEEPRYPGIHEAEQRKSFVGLSRPVPRRQPSAVEPPRIPRGRFVSTSFAAHASHVDPGDGSYRQDDDSSDPGVTSYENQAFNIPHLQDEPHSSRNRALANQLQEDHLQLQRVGYANDVVPDYPQASTFVRPYIATGQEAMEHYYNNNSQQRRLDDDYF
jgi:hypothetical protein